MWKSNTPNCIFRDLDDEEEQEFREWAKNNYTDDINISDYIGFWHPVVIDELNKIHKEKHSL